MKNIQKSKIFTKRIISFLLCLFFSFSCFLFSACSIEDEIENQTFFEQYIDGFKVVYSNSLQGYDPVLEKLENDFFLNVLGVKNLGNYGLAYFYGNANNDAVTEPNWFPDSIRMLVVQDSTDNMAELISITEHIWKWTFSQDIDNDPETFNDDILDPGEDLLYQTWKDTLRLAIFTDTYSTTFTNMYLLSLKIVMYEILLGYNQLTKFAPATTADLVNDTQAGLVAKVVSSSNSSIVGKLIANEDEVAVLEEDDLFSTQLKTYITKLQTDYLEKTKYLGFTKDNADRMIDYILDEVIGTDLVQFDYENYGPLATNTLYFEAINNQTKNQFKEILGLEEIVETDAIFNEYVDGLQTGDVIYTDFDPEDDNHYNYLVYNGKTVTEEDTTYSFKEYYNYRNYIDRVASIIYAQTYGGQSEFEYTREITLTDETNVNVSYDYVKVNLQAEQGDFTQILKGNFTSTPATFLRDFVGEDFFEDSETQSTYTFNDSPKAEYQSILMMLNTDKVFDIEAGMAFNILAYDENLEINITVRYYNYDESTSTGLMFDNFYSTTASFATNTLIYDPYELCNGYQSDFEIGFDEVLAPDSSRGMSSDGYRTFIIPPLTDQTAIEKLNTGGYEYNLGWSVTNLSEEITQEMIDSAQEASKYYKVIDSQNGYGGLTVLDENKIQSSFYEIIFDIVKRPTDPVGMDYDFKVNISPLIW
ncbi:MAG: hypothetical protein PHS54_04340 [Clostridia bacterium]|nr:hypothetical protein [Clostridia bacterium]